MAAAPHRRRGGPTPGRLLLATLSLVVLLLCATPTLTWSRQPPPPPQKPSLPARHEYKLSLRRPFYFADPTILSNATHPGSGNHPDDPDPPRHIPHYTPGGHTVAGPADLTLRLTPAVPRARGIVVADDPIRYDGDNVTALAPGMAKGWDVQLTFKMAPSAIALQAATSGKLAGQALPGIGMALWLTSVPLHPVPPRDLNAADPMFGADARVWDGVRIAIQPAPSAANPGKVKVSGAVAFEMADEHYELGECELDLRATDSPATLSMTYLDEEHLLAVWIDRTATGHSFTSCFSRVVALPQRGGYLALSAANGDLDRTDDVDILAMDVFALGATPRDHGLDSKPKQGMSSISYTPSDDTLKHAQEVEEKVHRQMKERDEQRLKEALAKDASKPPATSGSASSSPQVLVANAHSIEAGIAKLTGQVEALAAELAVVKQLVVTNAAASAINPAAGGAGASAWQQSIETQLATIQQLAANRHQELLDLLHGVKGAGESASSAAARAHEMAASAARAAHEGKEQQAQGGVSWTTLFVLMLGAQAVGMVAMAVWRKLRGGQEHKKFL